LINTSTGSELIENVRNNDRIIFDDITLAEKFYHRAKEMLPEIFDDMWKLKGLNERFRFYRYKPSQYFKWHRDGSYIRYHNEMSLLTFILYLNEDFDGGLTEFKWEKIQPKRGSVLVFPHILLHQGTTVLSGTKYVLRTDIMYHREYAWHREDNVLNNDE